MAHLFDGNGNEIEIGGGESGKLDVADYKIYEESNGTQSRQGVLTYNGLNLYPVNKPLQRETETKLYSGGLMVTLGDSYTAYLNSYFDTFAQKHGLIQKNVGLASSKIARPEKTTITIDVEDLKERMRKEIYRQAGIGLNYGA